MEIAWPKHDFLPQHQFYHSDRQDTKEISPGKTGERVEVRKLAFVNENQGMNDPLEILVMSTNQF